MKKNIVCTIVLILIISQISFAQYIYVDIIPDTTISANGGFYNLDLNGDGTFDYKINLFKTAFPDTLNQVGISGLTDSCFIAGFTLDACGYIANAFSINDAINDYADWSNNAQVGQFTLMFSTCMSTGPFTGQTNKYLGLKMIKNGTTFYGWVGINVASHANWFTLKDYACNINAINAGLTVGIHNLRQKDLDGCLFLYPNPSHDKLTIETPISAIIGRISIYNIHGQLVLNKTVGQDKEILDISGFRKGIYFLKLENTKGYEQKMFIKE